MLEHGGVGLAIDEREGGAPAPDVVAIARPIARVPVLVLLHHGFADSSEVRGRRGASATHEVANPAEEPFRPLLTQERPRDDLGEEAVALRGEVHAIEREGRAGLAEQLKAWGEQVDVRHPGFARGSCSRVGVSLEARVVLPAIGQERVPGILEGGRAEEHDAREIPAISPGAAGPRDKLEEVPTVRVRLVHAGERFVVPEKGEHDVRLHVAQVLGHVQLALAARVGVGAVAASAQVAEAHLLAREARLQQGLQPAVVLHPLRQRVAEERDDLALAQLEGQGIAVSRGHGEQLRLARRGRRGLGGRLGRVLRRSLGRRLRIGLRFRLGRLGGFFGRVLFRRRLGGGTGVVARGDGAGEARVLRRLHAARVA